MSRKPSNERLAHSLGPGHTAVVTGASLGIGRALVRQLAKRGMRVHAVDVDSTELENTRDLAGGDVITHIVDVSDPEAMLALAGSVGPASLLINNAATRVGQGFDADLADWRKAFDVNLWGVVHGVSAFLPGMTEGFVVNVGSKQGITNPPGHPVYNMTKSAVKTYSEQLEHTLRSDGRQISAHLLVPGWTTTGHAEHRPGAWQPEQVVDRLLEKLAEGAFYIVCPDGEVTQEMDRARILWGAGDIVENRPPMSRWDPDWADRAKSEMGE